MKEGVVFYLNSEFYGLETIQCKIFLISFIFVIIAFVSVAELLITHMLFISKGVSTIEDKSSNMVEGLIKSQSEKGGFLENMKLIGGTNLLNWLLPTNNNFKVYDGYLWLGGMSYSEYILERRTDYLKIYENEFGVPESNQNNSDLVFEGDDNNENNFDNFNFNQNSENLNPENLSNNSDLFYRRPNNRTDNSNNNFGSFNDSLIGPI
jgi:hypothetical protein